MAEKPIRPVPLWDRLPNYVRINLAAKGVTKVCSFDKLDAEHRLSVLNLYVKLNGVKIHGRAGWTYIRNITRAALGVIDFVPCNMDAIRQALTAERTFANPWVVWSNDWDSRELRLDFSLHLKRFGTIVSAHIDPIGLCRSPGVLGKLDPVTWMRHGFDGHGYQEVERIRNGLLKQGWDKAPLLGLP